MYTEFQTTETPGQLVLLLFFKPKGIFSFNSLSPHSVTSFPGHYYYHYTNFLDEFCGQGCFLFQDFWETFGKFIFLSNNYKGDALSIYTHTARPIWNNFFATKERHEKMNDNNNIKNKLQSSDTQ